MEVGNKIPNLAVVGTNGLMGHLSDFYSSGLVLYFYPKDATPGCTLEGQAFRDHAPEFQAHQLTILGVSRDALASHERFKAKQGFPFELISDVDEQLCQAFDVIKDKIMYGKKVRGIERSTFLIDATGHVVKVWRKVKVAGHVLEVLHTIKQLDKL